MIDNKAKHRVETLYQVENCRGCGRTYVVRAPVAANDGDGDVHTKCGRCGTTNATTEQADDLIQEGALS